MLGWAVGTLEVILLDVPVGLIDGMLLVIPDGILLSIDDSRPFG